MSYISPSVNIVEIDASAIVPTVANNMGVFCGNFAKGPVGVYTLISTNQELIDIYGLPSGSNFNDWYQVYNFLQYSGAILVARAADINGTKTEVSGVTVTGTEAIGSTLVELTGGTDGFVVGNFVTFGTGVEFYEVTAIAAGVSITLDRGLEVEVTAGSKVNTMKIAMNATVEAVGSTAIGEAVTDNSEYVGNLVTIGNFDEFETKETSLVFTNAVDSKIKIFSRNPGVWGNDLEVAIAKPSDFGSDKFAFEGISLDDLFEYYPINTEVGVIIKLGDSIVETFTVDFDTSALNSSGKSNYIETVINRGSSYIYIKENTTNSDEIKSYIYGSALAGSSDNILKLVYGSDSLPGQDDITDAYELFANPEEVEIDVVIANEVFPMAAINLVNTRKDAIAFVGARYEDTVGKKATDAVSSIITWRKTGEMNVNSMFVCVGANYKYQYDRKNFVA